MASYTSLWTSSKDPEFQQIKKIKQLSDRRLAMHVTKLQNNYNRHIKKSNDEIRENITFLEHLERDKEKRARHILATYLKVQKKKAAANIWTQKYFNSLAQKRSKATPVAEEKSDGPFVNIVTTRGSVSLKDFSIGKDKKKLSLPKIHLEKPKESSEFEKLETFDAVDSVQRANVDAQAGYKTGNETASNGSVKSQYSSDTTVGHVSKRNSIAESVDSLKVPTLAQAMNAMKKKQQGVKTGASPWNSGQGSLTKRRFLLRGSVYVTFPFVYHSQGEQTCPRYSLFRECTDYDPYTDQASGKMSASPSPSHRGSNASLKSILTTPSSRRNSQVPVGGESYPSHSRRGSKRVSFSNVAHVVRAIQSIHQ
ncbi:hypothetical protein ElyMa_002014700 [Elysia marginata]|uniref:Shugoshin C-terminal domain-containing protein n=1 Tax=Elysia marginata TaxID=1093978 RepID=A0AAV4F4B1_9GAST|nr:hypothetical protein ElyMa_002014700 [Elysia marginata]